MLRQPDAPWAQLEEQLQPLRLKGVRMSLKCSCGRKFADVWPHPRHTELEWTGVMDKTQNPVIDGTHARPGDYRPRPSMSLSREDHDHAPRVRATCGKCDAAPVVKMETLVKAFIGAARASREDLKFGDNLPA